MESNFEVPEQVNRMAFDFEEIKAPIVLQMLKIQDELSKELDKLLEYNFSQFKLMFEHHKLFILNEPRLSCDAFTDHLIPKSAFPIYEQSILDLERRLYAEVLEVTKQQMMIFIEQNQHSDMGNDTIELLLEKLQLSDETLENMRARNDQLIESNSNQYLVDTKTINTLKEQIAQVEKFGFIFRPDAVEKPQADELNIEHLEAVNAQLELKLRNKDAVIAEFESHLEIAFAELEKLEIELLLYEEAEEPVNSHCSFNSFNNINKNIEEQKLDSSKNSRSSDRNAAFEEEFEAEIKDYDEETDKNMSILANLTIIPKIPEICPDITPVNLPELEIYTARNEAANLLDESRFNQSVRKGVRYFSDLETGLIYFKGPLNIYGYRDINENFEYMNKDGVLLRIVDGKHIYAIDSAGRQIIPSTYGDVFHRIYVRNDDFTYEIDQFGQKYITVDKKRIDLDDQFNEVKLPFFRQYAYKMELLARYNHPELPTYFVDAEGEIIPEERLEKQTEHEVSEYKHTDGIIYYKDITGFYFVEGENRCQRDKSGKSYIMKENFAFKASDKSLTIAGKQYYYDNVFGFFYMLSTDGSRFVFDRAIKCLIIDEMHFTVVNAATIEAMVKERINSLKIINDKTHIEEMALAVSNSSESLAEPVSDDDALDQKEIGSSDEHHVAHNSNATDAHLELSFEEHLPKSSTYPAGKNVENIICGNERIDRLQGQVNVNVETVGDIAFQETESHFKYGKAEKPMIKAQECKQKNLSDCAEENMNYNGKQEYYDESDMLRDELRKKKQSSLKVAKRIKGVSLNEKPQKLPISIADHLSNEILSSDGGVVSNAHEVELDSYLKAASQNMLDMHEEKGIEQECVCFAGNTTDYQESSEENELSNSVLAEERQYRDGPCKTSDECSANMQIDTANLEVPKMAFQENDNALNLSVTNCTSEMESDKSSECYSSEESSMGQVSKSEEEKIARTELLEEERNDVMSGRESLHFDKDASHIQNRHNSPLSNLNSNVSNSQKENSQLTNINESEEPTTTETILCKEFFSDLQHATPKEEEEILESNCMEMAKSHHIGIPDFAEMEVSVPLKLNGEEPLSGTQQPFETICTHHPLETALKTNIRAINSSNFLISKDFACEVGVSFSYKEKHEPIVARSKILEATTRISQIMRSEIHLSVLQPPKRVDRFPTIVTLDPFGEI